MKGLTREARSDIIQKEFTQKQRVLFEKWIVTQREAESERETEQAASKAQSSNDDPKEAADRSTTASAAADDAPCMTVSLVPAQAKQRFQKKTKRKHYSEMKGMFRSGTEYQAKVGFDSLRIYTRNCDLSTAVEFLIILTSVKQRMQGASNDADAEDAFFGRRLQEALERSLAEYGRQEGRKRTVGVKDYKKKEQKKDLASRSEAIAIRGLERKLSLLPHGKVQSLDF